jgi:hypothetical protein
VTGKRVAAALLLALLPSAAFAYLHFRVTLAGQEVPARWRTFPVRYAVAEGGVPGVTTQELQRVVQEGVLAWRSVPGASVSFQFEGVTRGAVTNDRVATVGFEALGTGVLGVTRVLINTITGELVDGDIGLTTSASWTPNPPQADRRDLVATTTHELGHMLGLAHSAVGETETVSGGRRVIGTETIMFPISFSVGTAGRRIRPDDEASLRVLYPADSTRGSLSGRVTRGGRGVQGAHVVSFDIESEELVAGFTLNGNGDFTIGGLRAGPKVLRVEPLDDADFSSFFSSAFVVETGFQVTFHDRLVLVPAGGAAAPVTIEVAAR